MDTLGFEVQTTVPAASFVSAGGYHHHIGANTWHHRTNPSDGRGLSWFEVAVPEPGALDAVRERFAARRIPVTETDDSIEVTDPDGIEVRLRVDSPNQTAIKTEENTCVFWYQLRDDLQTVITDLLADHNDEIEKWSLAR